MFKKFFSTKFRNYFSYAVLFFAAITLIVTFVRNSKISDFINGIENKTFDIRQSLIAKSGYRNPSKDIVIVTIDDASYEYLLGKYGEWPIPREVYAKMIDYLELQKPSAIAFDLMFIKSLKSSNNSDMQLVNSVKKYNNVYLSMNFDNLPADVRKPVDLPKKFTVNVENDSHINLNNDNLKFLNCRPILSQLLQITNNVGMINVSRSDDGILREVPPVTSYKGDFYPNLALLVGLKYTDNLTPAQVKNFSINKFASMKIKNHTLPLDKDGSVILNWYGKNDNVAFQQVPFYKVIKAAEGDKSARYDFKNKIIYVGTTATSLYDIKSVPISKNYPGVAVHATFINNLIDNAFIKKVSAPVNILISILLAMAVSIVVIRTSSTIVALGTTILTSFGYIVVTYYIMKFWNLWIAIVLPITFIFLAFAAAYIIKYLLKSRDFEHQYKLATTDGLTELYNHRYFQEQMILQTANSERYNSNYSLILIDIDFFKKFNDTYGHQSGDAVLVQVAKRLKKNVRATDFVCRYGGEEMTIILPNTDKDEAIITAQKLCQVISEKPCKLSNGQESTVTISLGVATFPENGQTPAEIIAKADERLYYAKENGRNQVGF